MTDAWRFKIYGPDGTLKRIISRPTERKRVTESDRRAEEEKLREMYRKQGLPASVIQTVIGRMQFAEYFPVFASLTLGPQGSLWVQTLLTGQEIAAQGAAIAARDMGSRKWEVFGADGHYLGSVTFPAKFEPMSVVGDRFYGVAKDALDVETVQVYQVVMN